MIMLMRLALMLISSVTVLPPKTIITIYTLKLLLKIYRYYRSFNLSEFMNDLNIFVYLYYKSKTNLDFCSEERILLIIKFKKLFK